MQCFDFIRGFLELVGNSPENENSESSMLQGLKAEQAGETALRSHFCGTAVLGVLIGTGVFVLRYIYLTWVSLHSVCGQPVRDVVWLILQKQKFFCKCFSTVTYEAQ